ncbi:Partial AB-hydrolase lipase domain,Serine aminopeptidase, S33,Alpha/Beta hydrolase fold [Cinara cedri]|uniref:Partial AB-hydrolase lipase domain,Serine aminopeptidase, S33,Alpha/Beta hydrolase fold n=1 Tax=Cinara cedri TaxID=506608 RepID=A0A5E4M0D1_9HEMI|nr:Partial AB-hydrolase lipase domain,Serine aminopeptidase, S33,Alpha/Beta hydrolase fold [Cinara cedri]
MLAAPLLATAAPTTPLLVLLLAMVRFAAAERDAPRALAARRTPPYQQWRRVDGRTNYRRRLLTGGVHLPRRQWRQPTAAAAQVGEQLARHQRHFLASTVNPVMNHWRSIHDKLQVQSTWPGNGRYSDETSLLFTTGDYIRREGYSVERHTVITDDGYNLTLHRIPYGKNEDPSTVSRKPAVLVQHGILCSSTDWVIAGQNSSLAFVLSDAGYDVWLANSRGNTYSRNHVTLLPAKDPEKYWDFSWHEMGTIDLPNTIDYILDKTGEPDLNYVGHSMGTAIFFVLCSERPEYQEKVRSMAAMAPIAYLNHVKSPIMTFLSSVADPLAWLCNSLGYYEFRPNGKILLFAGKAFCEANPHAEGICDNLLFLYAGFDSKRLIKNILPIILAHTPAGASARQLTHFAQLMKRDRWFGQYNYNQQKNMEKYGQPEPPAYDLSQVAVPVALYHAQNDWLSTMEDVNVLAKELPNVVEKKVMPFPEFNHLDFLWANDIRDIVYEDLIRFMKRYDRKYPNQVPIQLSPDVDVNVVHPDYIIDSIGQ